MASLIDVLTSAEKKAVVVEDCLALIEAEVSEKTGLTGLALKAGYSAVKGIKPGFVKQVVSDLLPEFAAALDPLFRDAASRGATVATHFLTHASSAADALLAITDEKAQRSKSAVVKSTYEKLRGTAKKNVEAAIPRLVKLIEKHSA